MAHDGTDLPFGLYERLITASLKARLLQFDRSRSLVPTEGLDPAEAPATLARHIESIVARALKYLPAEDRTTTQANLVNQLLQLLATAHPASTDPGDLVALPPEQLLSIQPITGFPTTDRELRRPAGPALRLRPPRQRPRRAGARACAGARDPVRGLDRPALRLRPLARPAAPREAAQGPLRSGETAARHHHRLHRLHRAQGDRLAGGPRRGGQGLLRHPVDAPPRQGVDVPPRDRLLDGLHRFLQPLEVGPGRRRRVERPALAGGVARHPREVRRDLQHLLGEPRVRGLRPGAGRAAVRPRRGAGAAGDA